MCLLISRSCNSRTHSLLTLTNHVWILFIHIFAVPWTFSHLLNFLRANIMIMSHRKLIVHMQIANQASLIHRPTSFTPKAHRSSLETIGGGERRRESERENFLFISWFGEPVLFTHEDFHVPHSWAVCPPNEKEAEQMDILLTVIIETYCRITTLSKSLIYSHSYTPLRYKGLEPLPNRSGYFSLFVWTPSNKKINKKTKKIVRHTEVLI